MTIYVVTEGSYSDYHIEAIFSNKKDAEEYRFWHCDESDSDVEEYDVDSENIENKEYLCKCRIGFNDKWNIVAHNYSISHTDDHIVNEVRLVDRNTPYNMSSMISIYEFYENDVKVVARYIAIMNIGIPYEKAKSEEKAMDLLEKIVQDKIAEIKNYILVENMSIKEVNSIYKGE